MATTTGTPGVRRRRALVLAGATLAPVVPWLVARATGTELEVTLGGQPSMVISLPLVIITALAASLAGWAVLAVLQRVSHSGRTGRAVWTGLAVAGLLGSFLPLAATEASGATKVYLALAHVAVAAVLIPGLRATVPSREAARVPEWSK
ncbi:MAG: hypothetical protein GEV12_18905 [Micromonosporaceae bacterium]|nr:hypothetical protein [Micromonosporaceae bacterium]